MKPSTIVSRRAALVGAASLAAARRARAAEPVKVGMVMTMTGPFAAVGESMSKGANLFLANDAKAILGEQKVEVILRDDGGPNPDTAKRLVQELVTRDRVQYICGFQWTPNANAIAPLLNQAKVPCVLFNAAGVTTTRLSPWIARTSFTQWQNNLPLGQWAAGTRGYRRAFILVSDFSPGVDAEQAFTKGFTEKGGEIVGVTRMPIASPNFVPFLLHAKEARPDCIMAFHPGGASTGAFMKAQAEAGLREAGIQLMGPGDITSDDDMANIGRLAQGVVTCGNYSRYADRPANARFVEQWRTAYGMAPLRPSYLAVGAFDGMHAICTAIAATGGKADPAAAMQALANFRADSPRGPISIDPATRDIVQTMYIREVRAIGDDFGNVEIASFPDVKDPWKAMNPA